jgi:hypothetical protein
MVFLAGAGIAIVNLVSAFLIQTPQVAKPAMVPIKND